MHKKLRWVLLLSAAVIALVLATCRRFPEPGEPIVPTADAAADAASSAQ